MAGAGLPAMPVAPVLQAPPQIRWSGGGRLHHRAPCDAAPAAARRLPRHLAADGLQALERLADELPTVVLSDIEMPRMDGFDLARNIR
jgi:CheY-like chemotaxis protein